MPIGKDYTPYGPYLLVERLASGGMAEVFLARRRGEDERTVVVKRMHAALADSRNARARFLDEARIATLMEHRNIVRVLDVGEHDGSTYMAMEWLLGWELAEILDRARQRGERLPLPVIVKLAHDAAQGLAAAHAFRTEEGVALELVHRDISPRNLFVTADGILKILDFGLAISALNERRTAAKVVLGTYGYMSPEQIDGGAIDSSSDIFSLGVVLHELITGVPLFAPTRVDQMIDTMLRVPIAPPLRAGEEIDGALLTVVMRMLQRRKEARYRSAAEVTRDLAKWFDGRLMPSDQEVAAVMTRLFRGAKVETSAHVAVSHWGDSETIARERRRGGKKGWIGAALAAAVLGAALMLLRPAADRREPSADTPSTDRREPSADTPSTDRGEPMTDTPSADHREPIADTPSADGREPMTDPPSADHRAPIADKPPSPKNHRPLPKPPPRPPPARPSPAPHATGRLTLDVRPWANVYLGSTLLGASPLVEHEVPAGPVTLRLVDPVSGAEQRVVIDIPAGGDVRRVVKRD